MSSAPFDTPWGQYRLASPMPGIQAWSQADAYLLREFGNRFTENEPVATVNDAYGALSLALTNWPLEIFNDSAVFCHHLAEHRNNLMPSVHSIEALRSAKSRVFLLRLPKNLHFFQYQLSQLSGLKKATVLVAGMQKHWPAAFFQAGDAFFDDMQVLPGVKKAKCMILQNGKTHAAVEKTRHLQLDEFGLTLCNEPNVFSREQLDIGSRFFLHNMPDLNQDKCILDMACGNGVLGIYALKRFTGIEQALFVDESGYAISSCRASLQSNHIAPERYRLYHNNVLHNLPLHDVDTVLCNPPFHQQHIVSDRIAANMIRHSQRCLRPGGRLLLIGNRHLPYHAMLKRQFGAVSRIADNPKFTIYQAVKSLQE